MKRIRLFEIIGVLIMLSLTALACVSSPGTGDNLTGVTWVLKSYGDPDNLKAAIAGKEPNLVFDKEKDEIMGSGGVNGYGGKYEVDGNKLTIKEVIHTLIASTDEALNIQESEFFKILNSAQSFKMVDEKLTITGTEGVLVFAGK